jgi:hypothetical protein
VDLGKNGSRYGVVVDDILCHGRGSAMGNERLTEGMESSNGASKRSETIISGPLTKEEYPSMKYKKKSREHEAYKGSTETRTLR